MFEQSIGHTQIALTVLKVNGIDLVWHGTGAHLTGLHLLAEILHGDILPEVAVKVYDDGIDTLHRIKDGCQAVIVAYLSGILLTLQSQFVREESVGKGTPVILGICHMMGIEVTCGTTELGCHGTLLEHLLLSLESIDKHHHLLAQASRTGGLSVGFGQHGHIGPLLSILFQLVDEFLKQWEIHLRKSLSDTHGHTGIVDILRSETKMDKLLESIQSTYGIELLLEEILHSFHVMIGHLLYGFHSGSIGLTEVLIDSTQTREQLLRKRCQLGEGQLAQSNKILHLHSNAVTYQSILGEISSQRFSLSTITAIHGRYRCQQIQFHKTDKLLSNTIYSISAAKVVLFHFIIHINQLEIE